MAASRPVAVLGLGSSFQTCSETRKIEELAQRGTDT